MLTKSLLNAIFKSSFKKNIRHVTCFSKDYSTKKFVNAFYNKKPEAVEIPEPMPGIKIAEFLDRRNVLMQVLIKDRSNYSKTENHLVIIPSNTNGKHPKPSADLAYLTGIVDRTSVLLLLYESGSNLKTILFHEPGDCHVHLMGGSVKPEVVKRALQIDEMYPLSDIGIYLNSLFRLSQYKLWYNPECENAGINFVLDRVRSLPGVYAVANPAKHLQNMRLIKSNAEVNVLRKACNITSQAFNSAMAASRPGVPNEIIRSIIEDECEECGADDLTLSINNNNNTNPPLADRTLMQKDMVVADAGCEYNGYTAGMARTWPTSGEFAPLQKLMYGGVYRVQQKLIKGIASGKISTVGQLNDKLRSMMIKELLHIGFIKKAGAYEICKLLPSIIRKRPAGFIGMREEKPLFRNRSTALLPGMVLSLKPGLHIAENRYDIAPQFRGLSLQIQDNILIKPNGVEVLSKRCAADPNDIQQTVGSDACNYRQTYMLNKKKKCKRAV